jgi:hypothetical protein
MKLRVLGIVGLLLLTGCASESSESACASLQGTLAEYDYILDNSSDFKEVALTNSKRTDLYMKMDEVGCPIFFN